MLKSLDESFKQHRIAVDNLLEQSLAENKIIEQNTIEQESRILTIEWSVVLAISSICLLFMWRVYTSIKNMLGGEPVVAASVVSTIAKGNLAHPIYFKKTYSLLGQMEGMRGALNELIKKIQSGSHELHAVSDEVSQLGGQILSASNIQNDAASAIAVTVEEMTTSIHHISHNAEHVLSITSDAEETARKGVELINDLISSIDSISQEVNQVANEVNDLGVQTQSISKIVTTIKEIADQTNLLALNAAIEAARAGDSGRGFAVVADEVRMLAARTTESTREVDGMIKAIQSGTSSVVKQIHASAEHVNGGVAAAQRASHGIEAISNNTGRVLDSVRDVMNALNSQTGAISEAARNVEHVAKMSEENNLSIRSVNRHLNSLSQLAITLETHTDQFTVS